MRLVTLVPSEGTQLSLWRFPPSSHFRRRRRGHVTVDLSHWSQAVVTSSPRQAADTELVLVLVVPVVWSQTLAVADIGCYNYTEGVFVVFGCYTEAVFVTAAAGVAAADTSEGDTPVGWL